MECFGKGAVGTAAFADNSESCHERFSKRERLSASLRQMKGLWSDILNPRCFSFGVALVNLANGEMVLAATGRGLSDLSFESNNSRYILPSAIIEKAKGSSA